MDWLKKTFAGLGLLAALGLGTGFMVGCESEEPGDAIEDMADDAQDAADDAADSMEDAADEAGDAMEDAVN
ncbi:MAG: hypothetical protein AAF710_11565 [Planctomycetota bacterium]